MGRRESHLPAAPHISGHGVDLRGYRVDSETPWAADPQCRLLVDMHPDGMSLSEIAAVLVITRTNRRGGYTQRHVSRERIRQIEASAMRKLARDPVAAAAWLASMQQRSRERPSMAMEDHQPEGEWPTYEDSRRLQQKGNKGAWGWDGEARPPLVQVVEAGE